MPGFARPSAQRTADRPRRSNTTFPPDFDHCECRDRAAGSDLRTKKGKADEDSKPDEHERDGYVTTPFRRDLEAALMGRTTFEPALRNSFWPWPGLQVFVLASRRPAGTPDHVVMDSDPGPLLARPR
jgi:hypothetical protein